MVLLNLIIVSVFLVISVTGCGYGVYWLESGSTCRRIGAPDEHCVHYSKCSNRGISNFRTEFCHFDGLRPILCCVKEYLPYGSSEEDYEEYHPFTFSVDEGDYHKLYHQYGHDTKPTTSNYPGYYPPQKRPADDNSLPPNDGDGKDKPSTQHPRSTESIINPVFTSPTTQPPVNNDDRQNSNGIESISNTPTQQQNPTVNVQVPSNSLTTSSGIGVQKCREFYRAVPFKKPKHTPIIGGRPAHPKEFPHLVLLGYGTPDNKIWQCGASLISDQYVLTAAHCLNSRLHGTVRFVRLGELDVTTTDDDADEQDFDVAEIFRHPMYAFGSNYNDIAILRFNGSVPFTPYIRPACLGMTGNVENVTMIAAGWGLTEEGGVPASILQRATLKHVSNERCKAAYGTPRNLKDGIVDDIQICADGGRERRDACQGDSGGPLQYTNYDFDPVIGGIMEIVGVTSFGRGCGRTAGVYTRVLPYVPWIESIVWR